jgi:hypothetical protein
VNDKAYYSSPPFFFLELVFFFIFLFVAFFLFGLSLVHFILKEGTHQESMVLSPAALRVQIWGDVAS